MKCSLELSALDVRQMGGLIRKHTTVVWTPFIAAGRTEMLCRVTSGMALPQVDRGSTFGTASENLWLLSGV